MQVSLITCTYNSEKTIKDCCLSIYSQSCTNLEHIILDNNSHDQTLAIAKKYKIKSQRIFQQKSIGIYGALNEGLRKASGEVVGILHSDDEFIENGLFNASKARPLVRLGYMNYGVVGEENTFAKNRPQLDEKGNLLEVKEWDGVYR